MGLPVTYIAAVVLLTGFLVNSALSTVVVHFPSTCQPDLLARCHSLRNMTVCYDKKIYPTWCAFFDAGCHGGNLRPNVTSPLGYPISSCNVSVIIRPTTQSISTHAPYVPPTPSPFETRLFSEAITNIDSLLLKANQSGATVDEMKKIFSVQNHNAKIYERNDKCWAFPLDLTAISPWNSQSHNRKAGVLISPRHAVWARHYSMHVNTTLRFVDRNNNVIDRRITKTKAVPTSGHAFLSGYDIVVGELDSDVPSTISFAKVLPRNLTSIRPLGGVHVPAFDTDFEEKALVADISREYGHMFYLSTPSHSSLRYQLFEKKITGDSGNPVFMVLHNELVLLFVFTYGGAGAGTSITSHYDDINTIMADWGSGYSLTEVDLTPYLVGAGNEIPSIIG